MAGAIGVLYPLTLKSLTSVCAIVRLISRLPACLVGGHSNVHHLGVGEFQIVHQLDIGMYIPDLQTWIMRGLFGDSAERPAFIVVGGVDDRILRQVQELIEQTVILVCRATVLEVGTSGAANEQRIPGEGIGLTLMIQ